jgi:hypothetical protein
LVLAGLLAYIDTPPEVLAEPLLFLAVAGPLLRVVVAVGNRDQTAGRVLAALRDLQVALLEMDTQLAETRPLVDPMARDMALAETLLDAEDQTVTWVLPER